MVGEAIRVTRGREAFFPPLLDTMIEDQDEDRKEEDNVDGDECRVNEGAGSGDEALTVGHFGMGLIGRRVYQHIWKRARCQFIFGIEEV